MKLWEKIKAWLKLDSSYLVTVQEVKTNDIKLAIEEDEKRRGELGSSYANAYQRMYINPNGSRDNLVPYYDRLLSKMGELHIESPVVESKVIEVYIDNADKVLFATSKDTIIKHDIIELSHGGSGKKELVCTTTATFPKYFNNNTFCAITMKVEISLAGYFTGMNNSSERMGIIREELFNISMDILKRICLVDTDGFTVSLPKEVHNKKIEELGWRGSTPVSVTTYTYTNRNPQLDVLTGRESSDNRFYFIDLIHIRRLRQKKTESDFKYQIK